MNTVTCSTSVTSRVVEKSNKPADSVPQRPWTQSGAELLGCWVSVQGEIPVWHCRLVQVILHGLKQEETRDLNEWCTFRKMDLFLEDEYRRLKDTWVMCFCLLFLFQEQCLTHQGTCNPWLVDDSQQTKSLGPMESEFYWRKIWLPCSAFCP